MRNFSLPRWSTVVDRTLDILVGSSMREMMSYRKVPAEDAPLPKSNRVKLHGFGVTKYSFLFPFGRTSKTTFEVRPRMWASAGEDISEESNDGPAYDPQYFSPVPIHIVPTLKHRLNRFRNDKYQSALLKKSAITFTGNGRVDKMLLKELDRCGELLKSATTDEKTARVPLLLALRRACDDMAAAYGGQPIAQADVANALAYLRKQNLYAGVIAPSKDAATPVNKADRMARDLAWRLAYKMAVTERGMDLLYRLTVMPPSPAGAAVDIAEKDRQRRQHLHLKHFFKAADSLLDEHAITHSGSRAAPLRADPATLLDYCCKQCELPVAPVNTLLIHGLPGIQAELCREEIGQPASLWQQRIDQTEHRMFKNDINRGQMHIIKKFSDLFGKKFIDQATAEVTEECKALTALHRRQQNAMRDRFALKWVSDGHVSNAPGSFLDTVDQRCKKIGVYQQRRGERNARSGAKAFFKRSVEIITAKNRTFVPPALAELLQHNPDSMLLHREVMQSALHVFEEILLRDSPQNNHHWQTPDASGYALEAGPHRPMLDHIARLALIRHWQKQPLHYLSNNLAPTQFDISKLTSPANLHQLFGNHPALATDGPRRDALIAAFKNALPACALSPELLVEWAQKLIFDRSAPNDQVRAPIAGRPHASKSNHQLHDEFATSIAHLQHGWKSSMVQSGDPIQDFNNIIAEQIEQMRLGNLRTISGGTSHGISMPAVTVPITLAKTMGMVKLLVGGTYSHRGMVNLEVGIASWGGFIRVTTSREDQLGVNVGLTAGPKAQWGTAVGGAAVYGDVEGAGSGYRANGYCFCLPRGGAAMTGRTGSKPGVNGDAQVAAGLAQIWRILTDTSDAVEQEEALHPMETLRRIGEAVPDVSVSMVGPGDSHNQELYAGVRAGVILGLTDESKQYGIGFNGSASAIYSRRKMRYHQSGSALQVDVANRTVRKSVNLQANLPLGVGLGRQVGNVAVFNNGAQSIAGPLFGMGGANAEIWKSGLGTQTNRVIYEGKISKNTYANIFHPNAKPFCDAVEKNLAKWANHMAAHDPDCPAAPATIDSSDDWARARGVAEIRQGLVDKHTKAIRKYLARVKSEVHPSDVYFDFLELTPAATDMLNHYYASEIEFRAAGCNAEADLCKKAFDAIWTHDDAWSPYFIVNSFPQVTNSGASFNLVLSASSEQPNASNRFPNYCG